MKKIITTLLLALLTTNVYALDLDLLGAVGKNDIVANMLKAMFGTLVEHTVGITGGADPIANAMSIFTGVCMIFAGLLAGYTLITGVIGTAQDGEMMGKKISSVWVPIRYSICIPLLLPLMKGGYTFIQLLVVWFVMQGIGAANLAATAATTERFQGANTTVSTAFTTEMESMVVNVYQASTCVYANKKEKEEGWFSSKRDQNWGSILDTNTNIIKYGYQTKNGKFFDVCGSIKLPEYQKIGAIKTQAPSKNPGYLGSIDMFFERPDLSSLSNVHTEYIKEILLATDKTAHDAVYNSSYDNLVKLSGEFKVEINKIISRYISKLQETASKIISNPDLYKKTTEQTKKYGFAMLGTSQMATIGGMDSINKAINVYPTIERTIDKGPSSPKSASDVGKLQFSANSVLYDFLGTNDIYQWSKDKEETEQREKEVSGSSQINRIISWLTAGFAKLDLETVKDDARPPAIVMAEMGHRLKDITITATLAASGAAFIGGILSLTGLISALIVLSPLLFTLFSASYLLIFLQAYVVPNAMFIAWIGILLGYLVLCVEAILAANLWLVMHLTPTGDEKMGSASQGYGLLFSLFFRPILIVFGIIIAVVIQTVVGEFVNKVFFSVFFTSQNGEMGGAISSVFSTIGGLMIYTIIQMVIITISISIAYKIPDQLMRWSGAGTGGLGEFGDSFWNNAKAGLAVGAAGAAKLDPISNGQLVPVAAKLGSKIGRGYRNTFKEDKPHMGKYVSSKDNKEESNS